jgi:hypothetical protein
MKFIFTSFILAILAALVLAAASTPQTPIVVSYPKDTPQSIIDEAMDAIKHAVQFSNDLSCLANANLSQGGVITHEYSLIKGFAAKVNAKMVETVQALGADHDVIIEQDREISINA